MSIPSNSYAEKVFAEHPLGLWSLDEPVSFISLLNNVQKRIDVSDTGPSGWSISGGIAEEDLPTNLSVPLSELPVIGFTTNNTNGIALVSNQTGGFLVSSLDSTKNTFTISMYLNTFAADAQFFEVGYKYGATEELRVIPVDNPVSWQFISETFTVPVTNERIQIVIKTQSDSSGFNYFLVNGLGVGQWSENFNSVNTGVTPIDLILGTQDEDGNSIIPSIPLIDFNFPQTINLTTSKAAYAYGYGISESSGYYLASSNKLYAYNDGVPMVYGANSVTKIVPRPNDLPSLIIPGFGFMNNSGQYQDLTFETWLRIHSKTTTPKRIIGPINSSDGLYVDGPFLILQINNYFGSYQVGEWGRPMLVQIRLSTDSASLIINGEQVISLVINTESLIFPKKFFVDEDNNDNLLDQDWIGFYAYADVPLIEIDCPAIYSYAVPEILAKKRFVYGQGVSFPNNTFANLDSFAAFVDYKVSDFGNSYMYPDKGIWNRGIKNNVFVTRNILSTPNYALPETLLNNDFTVEEWLQYCKEVNLTDLDNPYVDFTFADGGYFVFNKFDFLIEEPLKAFYGVFRKTSPSDDEQVLFKIIDEVTGNHLRIVVQGEDLNYKLTFGGVTTTIYSDRHVYEDIFAVGLEIDKFTKYFENNLSAFFNARNRLKIYVGGEPGVLQTQSNQPRTVRNSFSSFQGKIYKVDFLNARSFAKQSNIFDPDDGVILDSNDLPFIESVYNVINYDGGFAESEDSEYTLIYYGGSPSTTTFTQTLDSGNNIPLTISDDIRTYISSYTLLPQEYANTFTLDIGADSYWQDYVPLKSLGKLIIDQEGKQRYGLNYVQFNIDYPTLKQFSGDNYNLDNTLVKTYVSFQYVSSGANRTDQSLTTVPLSKTNVVIPSSNWINAKYQVTNDTIIYMPPSVNFETLAMVVHIDLSSQGILNKALKIKNMHLAGRSLNQTQSTPINTKFGIKLLPYYKNGIYENYQAKNPINIYKQSTPHLYLSDNSGVALKELTSNTDDRGIEMPINYNKLANYSISSIQLTIKYEKETFPVSATKIFEVYYKDASVDSYIDFYIQSSSATNNRGTIFAKNRATDQLFTNVNYFINGKVSKNANLFYNEWNILGLQFSPSLSFNSDGTNFTGSISITGPILTNNIVVYEAPELQEILNVRNTYWSEVLNEFNPNWDEINYATVTWGDVAFEANEQNVVIDNTETYNNFTQGNKIIASDDFFTVLTDFKYTTYTDVTWKTTSIQAA